MMQPNGIDPSDDVGMAPKSPISEMMTREAKAIMDGEAPPLLPAPAYKSVQLRFGDAAVTLNGDGSLGGDLGAFTAALETINPAADDVAFAVGWLVARSELWVKAVKKMEEIAEAVRPSSMMAHVDPDPGDADPIAPEDQAAWQTVAENDRHLSERATHEAAQARVTRDYNA